MIIIIQFLLCVFYLLYFYFMLFFIYFFICVYSLGEVKKYDCDIFLSIVSNLSRDYITISDLHSASS